MLPQKQAEEAIVSNFNEAVEPESGREEVQQKEDDLAIFSVKNLLWHGGSAWDAWFSCASNQVLHILTTCREDTFYVKKRLILYYWKLNFRWHKCF